MDHSKPFPCKVTGCKASFNTEDHLAQHSRRHELTQLELPEKNALFSDKTPTPTKTVDRLLKNCDDVGLFEDLQNVNPFDETFRKAVESNQPIKLGESPMKALVEVTGTTGGGDLNTPNCFPIASKTADPVEPTPVEDKPTTSPPLQIKKPRLMLKNLANTAAKKPPKLLPKPQPPSPQSGSTKDRLKAFLLKESIAAAASVPKLVAKPRPNNTAKRKATLDSSTNQSFSTKPGVVTVEERNREAARRYRQRLKVLQSSLAEDNDKLKLENKQLREENTNLKQMVAQLQLELTNVSKNNAASRTVAATSSSNEIIEVPETTTTATSQIYIILPPSSGASTDPVLLKNENKY